MAGTKEAAASLDESYDRYRRLRWQPVALFFAIVALALAIYTGTYQPRLMALSIWPSSMLSLDQRVSKIMSLTPLIGMSHRRCWCCSSLDRHSAW
jgi:hypothetical protein